MLLNIKSNNTMIGMSDTLSDYYNDVRKYDLLTEDEEKKLFEELRENEELASLARKSGEWNYAKECEEKANDIRCAIANANLRFVISVARVYGTNEDISDLISEGNIGLMEAIDRYDAKKNNKFSTFAVYYIRRNINQYRQDESEAIRKNNISKTFHIQSKMANKFTQENGREPSSEELMAYINKLYPNLSLKDPNDLMQIKMCSIDYTDDAGNTDRNANEGNLIDYEEKSASYNTYEMNADNEHRKALVSSMIRTLDGEDATIIKMYFGIDREDGEELNFLEIATRLGIEPEYAKKSVANSMKKLKKKFNERLNVL